MRKVSKLILSISFSSLSLLINAQDKYAVLIAVDNYYDAPGVKSHSSLSGCVNDAKGMKGLLETKFGFDPRHIYTLYDEKATKKAVINQMRTVYQSCKAGDAVVFFFSGHGVWMTNESLMLDPVKRGMSQAIVLSDLYSPGWDCLMRDETLKNIFNQFVDKKIILTSIFDCCYSANLAMNMGPPRYWTGWFPFVRSPVKDMDINSIPYIPQTQMPPGCRVDSSGNIIDTVDTDGDGVPDCGDWEIETPWLKPVDSMGVLMYPPLPDEFGILPDNYYDSAWFVNDSNQNAEEVTRRFKLSDALTVSNISSVRPSERENSGFLSLSASADNLKGLEITDLWGNRHGAFTAALLMAYQTSPPTITVADLWKKIEAHMAQQSYNQSPKFQAEASRLNKNLIGFRSASFSNKIFARCISVRNGTITIDKGWTAGIAKGNTLANLSLPGRDKIQIGKVYADSAIAADRSNGRIKPGHSFELTDAYISSSPHIKLYVPSVPFTRESFEQFFKDKITPLAARNNYMDYYFEDMDQCSEIIFWDNASSQHKFTNQVFGQEGMKKDLFCVFLPVPSYIAEQVTALIRKDQNMLLVSNPRDADLVLYLNYVKNRPGVRPGFVFYFHPPIKPPNATMGEQIFSEKKVILPRMNISNQALQPHSRQLYTIAQSMIRKKTHSWINHYPKR